VTFEGNFCDLLAAVTLCVQLIHDLLAIAKFLVISVSLGESTVLGVAAAAGEKTRVFSQISRHQAAGVRVGATQPYF